MKYFYSHLIQIEPIVAELEILELRPEHKQTLATLIDAHIHQTVIELVLSRLSGEDKLLFYRQLLEGDAQTLEFLQSRLSNIEEDIKTAVGELKMELSEDIKQSKRIKS